MIVRHDGLPVRAQVPAVLHGPAPRPDAALRATPARRHRVATGASAHGRRCRRRRSPSWGPSPAALTPCVLHQHQRDVVVEPAAHPLQQRALQRGQPVADGAVARAAASARSAVGKNCPSRRASASPSVKNSSRSPGSSRSTRGCDHRHEAQRRRIGRRVERDDLAAAQQQRRRMAAVDDRQRAAALLDQRRGHEVLVADRRGPRPGPGRRRSRAGRPARTPRAGTSRARCWPAGPRPGPCRARRR